ncbi:MAG: hypothetical protein LDL31_08220 [Prosthecobacter sp.]|jgi:hypothetical protein|nr:hypothetical protein [Prosthecobacter sp.]
MKTILSLAAALTFIGFALPSETQAWDHCATPATRIISYTPCGRPVYAIYQVYGRDRWGNPLGRWVTQQSGHTCGVCNPRPVCPPSYGHGYHRPIVAPVPVCPPRPIVAPTPVCPPRSSVSWFFSFGR